MPTERFLNLPEEKKKRVLQAAMAEFARVPFEDVSINRIVQKSGISRGSFYQYFEDKQDLRGYLLSGFRSCLEIKVKSYLIDKKGDLFQFFKDAFDEIINEGMKKDLKAICKNAFSQMRYGGDCLQDILVEGENGKHIMKEVLVYIKEEYYPGESTEKMILVGEILVQLMKEAIANVFLYEEEISKIRENYCKKVDLIEAGMKAVKEKRNV